MIVDWLLLGAPPALAFAWVVARKYGVTLWRHRRKVAQVVEVLAGDDTLVTTTTTLEEPVAAPVADAASGAVLSTLIEQVGQLRSHSQWQDERMDALEARLTERDDRIAVLERELASARAELARSLSDNAELTRANADLVGRVCELEAELAALRAAA